MDIATEAAEVVERKEFKRSIDQAAKAASIAAIIAIRTWNELAASNMPDEMKYDLVLDGPDRFWKDQFRHCHHGEGA